MLEMHVRLHSFLIFDNLCSFYDAANCRKSRCRIYVNHFYCGREGAIKSYDKTGYIFIVMIKILSDD